MDDNGIEAVAELARLTGVDAAVLSRYMSNNPPEPSTENLLKLARTFQVPIVDMYLVAGVWTHHDLIGWQVSDPRMLPKEIRAVLADLDSEDIPAHMKRVLLRGVGQARAYFWEIYGAEEPAPVPRKRVRA